MMILHTVNKSPAYPLLDSCARFMGEEDALILIEDGVYAAARGRHDTLAKLIAAGVPVYAMKIDVDARGIAGRLLGGVDLIEYSEFVELCTRYAVVKSWF